MRKSLTGAMAHAHFSKAFGMNYFQGIQSNQNDYISSSSRLIVVRK